MTDDQRDAAVKLATSYRLSNEHVDLSLHPMKAKKFFSNADSNNARYAVFIGPDDISNEYAKLKDMQTGEEKKIDLKTGVILSS